MPYRVPRAPVQQEAYNRQLQESFAATRRVAPPQPGSDTAGPAPDRDPVADLKEVAQLHATGVLNDAEFALAKAKILGANPGYT
jgi:hypothetical protein